MNTCEPYFFHIARGVSRVQHIFVHLLNTSVFFIRYFLPFLHSGFLVAIISHLPCIAFPRSASNKQRTSRRRRRRFGVSTRDETRQELDSAFVERERVSEVSDPVIGGDEGEVAWEEANGGDSVPVVLTQWLDIKLKNKAERNKGVKSGGEVGIIGKKGTKRHLPNSKKLHLDLPTKRPLKRLHQINLFLDLPQHFIRCVRSRRRRRHVRVHVIRERQLGVVRERQQADLYAHI